MSQIIDPEAFKVIEGRPVTSSLKVAEYFNKPHNDVLKSIRRLIEAKIEFSREGNFSLTAETKRVGATARKVPFYWMDRKGFAILAMGFTGAKALDFKCAFYDEYERLENALRNKLTGMRETITVEQQQAIRAAIAKQAKTSARHYQTLYRALYERFQIPRYDELLAKDFDAAMKFIGCADNVAVNLVELQPGDVLLHKHEVNTFAAIICHWRYTYHDHLNAIVHMLQVVNSPLAPRLVEASRDLPLAIAENILSRHGVNVRMLTQR